MKNKIYLLLIISVFIASCSKDSSDESEIDNPSTEETYKYLKRITYTDFNYGEQNIDFSYQEGLLLKENDGGELVYFEYNSSKKIELIKECSNQNLTNINLETYNCTEFYPPTFYLYTNGKLSGFNNSQNEKIGTINYDSKGYLISEVPINPYSESLHYTYDANGNVLKRVVKYGTEETTYTYVWDGKKNPFNVFWKKYNYYDWGGQSIKPYNHVSSINTQNATKVYKNNVLIMEANYTYDADGYPTSCGFTEYLSGGGSRQGTVTFTYK